MTTETITELVAVCIHEPRGTHGLEGYQRAVSYRCQFVEGIENNHSRYYRVFPSEHSDYYECAIPREFSKFFKVEEKSS